MKALFEDKVNESEMIIGLEPNNNISMIIENRIIELDHKEAQEFSKIFRFYLQEQEENIRKQLPWYKRIFP